MSRENCEIVRRVYEAAARRDSGTVLGFYHPEVELDASRLGEMGLGIGRGVFHGHEGLRRWLRDWYGSWETVEDDLEDLIDAGGDEVVSVMIQRGQGRSSGIEIGRRLGAVWTIREGKVTRVVWFPTKLEALEAAGLSG